MVYTCCEPNCSTGYKSVKSLEKVPVYKFPENEDLKQSWIKAIPHTNWIPTNSRKVCAKHFDKDHFITASLDHRKSRKLARDSVELSRMRLKRSAVPHIFPNLPKYLSTLAAKPRSTASLSNARCSKDNAFILEKNEALFKNASFKLSMIVKKNLAGTLAKWLCKNIREGFYAISLHTSPILRTTQ